MGGLFNLDNPIWSFMGKIADLILLNLLVVVCSLPIFTIGASWTALYFVTVRMARNEESYIVKDFLRSFRDNFKQATIIWMFVLVAIVVFVGDILIYRMMPGAIPEPLMVAVMVVAFLVLCTIIYVFPVLSRFQNTIKGTLKNAFLISLVNIPYTIAFVVLAIIPIIALIFVYQLAPLIIIMGISLPAYLASFLWVRIFRKFEPKGETTEISNIGDGDEIGEEKEIGEEI